MELTLETEEKVKGVVNILSTFFKVIENEPKITFENLRHQVFSHEINSLYEKLIRPGEELMPYLDLNYECSTCKMGVLLAIYLSGDFEYELGLDTMIEMALDLVEGSSHLRNENEMAQVQALLTIGKSFFFGIGGCPNATMIFTDAFLVLNANKNLILRKVLGNVEQSSTN